MLIRQLTVTQKGLVLVLVPVLFELTCVSALTCWLFPSVWRDLSKLEHQSQVMFYLTKIGSSAGVACTRALGYRNPESDERAVQIECKKLDDMCNADSFAEEKKLPELKETLETACNLADKAKSVLRWHHLNNQVGTAKRDAIMGTTFSQLSRDIALLLIEFSNSVNAIAGYEDRLKSEQSVEMDRIRLAVFQTLLLLLALNAGLTLWLVRVFASDFLSRLVVISENAQNIALGKELSPPERGQDEVALLDAVIHEARDILADSRLKELAVIENAADVICSLDENLRFMAVNAAALKRWHYRADDLLGMSLLVLFRQNDSEFIRAAFRRIAATDAEGEFECAMVFKSGNQGIFHWSVRWSKEEKTYSCVVQDITEKRAVERLKQQILLIASHDLRSPLASLQINIELALSGGHGNVPAKAAAELGKAQENIFRLNKLIDSLLDLGKLESGTQSLRKGSVSALIVSEIAIDKVTAKASSVGVKILKPHKDALMLGDESRLVQCLVKLLENAINSSPRGSAVSVAIESSNDFIVFRVTDNGPGLPPDTLASVFEKFRPSHSEAASGRVSSGIELAIVKAIATAHGGEVDVSSQEGKGCIFFLRIPKSDDPEEEGSL